jgi:two-component system, chemotaxis family, protein-glutamate methylesterase/glutaminase
MLFKRNELGEPVLIYDDSPPIFSMKPAINPTFVSAAEVFKNRCMAIVLTGMGIDGTEGAKAVKNAKGRIIAQNEETSDIYGMPKSVVDLKLADAVMSPEEIVNEIYHWSL